MVYFFGIYRLEIPVVVCGRLTEKYPKPCQTSKVKRFVILFYSLYPLSIFTKSFILGIWQRLG